jgi:hypothetical protein
VLKGLYCRITRHRVNRRRVWNDQLNFRTSCERCGAPLLRDSRGWRLFDGERDANELRDTHPRILEPAPD